MSCHLFTATARRRAERVDTCQLSRLKRVASFRAHSACSHLPACSHNMCQKVARCTHFPAEAEIQLYSVQIQQRTAWLAEAQHIARHCLVNTRPTAVQCLNGCLEAGDVDKMLPHATWPSMATPMVSSHCPCRHISPLLPDFHGPLYSPACAGLRGCSRPEHGRAPAAPCV